ncbi:hypothetical protein [Sneathiella sp.]|jgi:hypothetical protein|uniref:hypothetical protein n=1 Tax=Sneathiella sp. TaxID=1964365 RepID=UPI0039E59988
MTLENIIEDFTREFGESNLEPQHKVMIMWLTRIASNENDRPIYFWNKKGQKAAKSLWPDNVFAPILAELMGGPLDNQVRAMLETKKKGTAEQKALDFVYNKYFGILSKTFKKFKKPGKETPEDFKHYKEALKKILTSIGVPDRKAKKFSLKKLPSQIVKDFRWALANCVVRDNKEDLLQPIGEIRKLEDLIRFSKSAGLRELHRNIEAVDYLLGSDQSADGSRYLVETVAHDHIPPYVAVQLATLKEGKEINRPAPFDPLAAAPAKLTIKCNQKTLRNLKSRDAKTFLSSSKTARDVQNFIAEMTAVIHAHEENLRLEQKGTYDDNHIEQIRNDISLVTSLLAQAVEKAAKSGPASPVASGTPALAASASSDRIFSDQLERCFQAGKGIDDYRTFVEAVVAESHKIFASLSGPDDNFMKACEYEAVNALIAGDLHRLDPVNGDASCQFRVPFVADLYAAVIKEFDPADLAAAADEYKRNGINVIDFMAQTSQKTVSSKQSPAMKKISKQISHKFTTFDLKIPEIPAQDICPTLELDNMPAFKKAYETVLEIISTLTLSTMTGFASAEPKSLEEVWKNVQDVPASYMTTKFERVYFSETSTLRYLTLCRALTVKRLSFYDDFYVTSHVISKEFPVMTESDMQEIYVELAWYSSAYIKAIFTDMVDLPYERSGPADDLNFDYSQLAHEDGRFHLCTDQVDNGFNPAAEHMNEMLQETEWYYIPKTAAGNVISYYENKRLLYMYLFVRQMPIILDLRRIIATPTGIDQYAYAYSGGGVYYFTPCPKTKRFVHIPADQLTQEQACTQGLCIEGYSMMVDKKSKAHEGLPDFAMEKDYSKFEAALLQKTDLIDQILITTMSHPPATGSTVRRSNDTQHYMRKAPHDNNGFTKLTNDDAISLYARTRYFDDHEPSVEAETPATDLYLSEKYADISDFDLELTGEKRGFLPLFANSYNGNEWNLEKERALIAAISEEAGYRGYFYAKMGNDKQGNSCYIRNAVTYLLTCRHLYVSSFERKMGHYQAFHKILGKPDSQRKSKDRYLSPNSGIDGNLFME